MNTDTIPHNGTDTSVDAATSIEEHLPRLERAVLEVIVYHDGATCDEVEQKTGLAHQTASARIRGLAKRNVIRDSGSRRPTRSGRKAIVWTK
jgi:hypothetical protein